ncbi:helix-turn-helix domain-containing protein [Streptomyces sp. NPDC050264]|uniref:helix-turn-helix domain-containing protein n=1 Tax=Streptomyces sp. NPDC050264 TaxID=3155038 RepID=UPI0034147C87
MASERRYALVKPGTMRLLMERTGAGCDVSVRELAELVGIPHSTVDALLNGKTASQPMSVALRISQALGVDELCLWSPCGRAVRDDEPFPALNVPASA